ncbi:ion channel [Flavobacteriales bacterium]|nr:ion channel [Flavobacteriales bacterium]
MAQEELGFGDKYNKDEKRLFNKDGSFNIRKTGVLHGVRDIYIHLIKIPWGSFILGLFGAYFFLNIIFAFIYFLIGIENLSGATTGNSLQNYMSCLYFSSQTFTTVGYGTISPVGVAVNLIAAIEAMIGLLSFALATGLLFGRFSRANLKLKFSENILISDYAKNNGKGLMFRVTNRRNTILLDTSAEVIASTYYTDENGEMKRDYSRLELELSEIKMFPSLWTIVHPIGEDSIFGKNTLEELKQKNLEILVLIKSHDETYGQIVHTRTSYKGDEIIDNANFLKSSLLNKNGDIKLDINTIGKFVKN